MNEGLIGLGLNESDSTKAFEDIREAEPTPAAELATFSARLLALVSDTVVESDTLRTYEFKAKLEKYRHQLANSINGDANTSVVASDCLRLCEDYLTRARAYLLEREGEVAEVIEVMRTALGKLAGEAKSFNVRLMGSSERFTRLTDIEDIRELKRHIAQEVRDLNRTVTEKLKQDELDYEKLSKSLEILQTSLTHTRQEASLDPLTRLANRGAFDRALEHWVHVHKGDRRPFVLAVLDLDNFKQINDTHGHQIGDRVLFCAAQWFGKSVRSSDFLARYGGEEFAILLDDIELSQAEPKFTELLGKIAGSNYWYKIDEEQRVVAFTASCGLAESTVDESAEDLLRRADEALYVAKRTGKNRVVVAKKTKSLWQTLRPFRKTEKS